MPGPFAHSVEERTVPATYTLISTPPWGPPRDKPRPDEASTIVYSKLEKWDGTSRLVIANHGHGASSNQFAPNSGPGLGVMALVRTGRYIVVCLDGGPTFAEWASAMNMQANKDVITWARAAGVKSGKFAGLGWSMGGLTTLNLMRRYAELVGAWLWVPAIDLDYFNSTPGYVPDYGLSLPNNSTWSSEISAVPGGVYRAQSAVQSDVAIPVSFSPIGTGATITLADASRFADELKGRRLSASGGTLPNFSYYGKDATHLYDCISTGEGFTLPAGNLCTQNFGESDKGYNPYRDYLDYRPSAFGANRKIALALTSDDPTVPPAIADAWLTKVTNPNIALAKPKTLGGHTMMFGYYSDEEIVNFYDSLDWS